MFNRYKKWRAATSGVALNVLLHCSQVAEDTGNSPHGFVRLRIAIDMMCNENVVILSPRFPVLIIAELQCTSSAESDTHIGVRQQVKENDPRDDQVADVPRAIV